MKRIALVFLVFILSACAGTMKELPNGNYANLVTVGDTLDRSTSVYGEYDCPKDEAGKVQYGKCKLVGKDEAVHGQTVAGQAIVGAVAGVGAAATNGLFGRSIAKIGQCTAGALCDATIINNSVQSAAQALVDNKSIVKVGMPPTVGLPSCAKSNTCGD